MPAKRHCIGTVARLLLCGTAAALAQAPTASAARPTLTVLYNFQGGQDGAWPLGTPVADRAGNLFGTTLLGGPANLGTIWELSPPAAGQTQWTETQLFAFGGKKILGSLPGTGLLRTGPAEFFGTTESDGGHRCGNVFRLRLEGSAWVFYPIYQFGAQSGDGCRPEAKLAEGPDGALYGTTRLGGSTGNGTVFKLTPPVSGSTGWIETVIWTFTGTDGAYVSSTPVLDAAGNLYGTAESGSGSAVHGTVWELSPPGGGGTSWTEQTLWTFSGHPDGYNPSGTIAIDGAGRIWGTCNNGGPHRNDYGVAWMLTPPASGHGTYTETLLHAFAFDGNGAFVGAGLEFGGHGTLEGVAYYSNSNMFDGSVYELYPPAPSQLPSKFRALWRFTGGDGASPAGLPLRIAPGVFIGANTDGGQANVGTIYELTK